MHTIVDLLDAAAVKLGHVSDSKLAAALGTSSQNISRWRGGLVVPGNESIVPLAKVLGIEPYYAIACMVIARDKDDLDHWRLVASADYGPASKHALRTIDALLTKTAESCERRAQELLDRAREIRRRAV
jgi:transcriptional regulator with XRE-family HTH domain